MQRGIPLFMVNDIRVKTDGVEMPRENIPVPLEGVKERTVEIA